MAAQDILIEELSEARPDKTLVFVTLIPAGMTYAAGHMSEINIKSSQRWLKDRLKRMGANRPIIGSVDFGWEHRRGTRYLQLHWHLAFWSRNPEILEKKLKLDFLPVGKHERPVDVKATYDTGFLGYQNKVVKLPRLLRTGRKILPELLLALDPVEPLNLLVLSRLRLGAHNGELAIRPFRSLRSSCRIERTRQTAKLRL